MDNTIDKEALMNSIFLGKGLTNENHPQGEVVVRLKPDLLVDFHSNRLGRQPYRIRENADLVRLTDSVAERGVFEPLIVRHDPVQAEKYEVISGHRRKVAALRADAKDVPIIVKDVDDDEANIMVCDGNLHREDILPSEKAWAYRIKLEHMTNQGKRQGQRTDLTSAPLEQKLERKTSVELLAEEAEDSRAQIQRYIRLTYLLPDLLELVDEEKLKFRTGVELSYLKESEQEAVLDVMVCDKAMPSLEQAQELKQMSKEGRSLTSDLIHIYLRKEPSSGSGLTASYINKLLPKQVRKMPVERKKVYTEKAIKYYAAYLQEHPEEADEWKIAD